MNVGTGVRRARFVRSAVIALAGLVVGGMLALGLSAPAFAASDSTLNLRLTNKAGVALTSYTVYPVDVADGTEIPGDHPAAAMEVAPGLYEMTGLTEGDNYTLLFVPNGAAATSGTIQFLGGTATLAGASTFTLTAVDNYQSASIATGATITGKVTGPTGLAVKNAEVDAFQFDGTSWRRTQYVFTNSLGVFTFSNAVPGSYKFEFYYPGGSLPPIFAGGSTSLTASTATFVPVGSIATVNQKFAAPTGAISGTALVTIPDGFGTTNLYYDDHLIAVALPVTAQDISGHATAVNTDASVASAPSSGKGVWAIKNLPTGKYVVQTFPHYTQESSAFWRSNGDVSTGLSTATVITVTSGHTYATGTTVYSGSGVPGANPEFEIHDSADNAIAGVNVTVAPTTDPRDFVTGTSISNGNVTLNDSNDQPIDATGNPIQPGWYTVTVIDPSEQHEPYTHDYYFGFDTSLTTIVLPNLIAAPGFDTAADIAQTATLVGTPYAVTATPIRADAVLGYQWLRDGQPIYGATTANYTSTGADVGHQLSVRVAAYSFGFSPVYSVASVGGATPTPTIAGDQILNATAPSITPATGAFVGTTLQAHVGDWTIDGAPADGLTYQYNWSTGAHGSTYVVQPGDVAASITVDVIATKPGFVNSDPATSPTAVVPALHPAALLTKVPVVTKTVVAGVTTYSTTTGTWNTTGLNFTYAWSIGATAVTTVPSSTPTVTSTEIGQALPADGVLPAGDALTLVITAKRIGYVDGPTVPIAVIKGLSGFIRDTAPTIHDTTTATDVSGTDSLNFGDHLTVSAHGTWEPTNTVLPSSYAYQWYRNGVKIVGATTASYVVGAADIVPAETTQLSVIDIAVSPYYATTAGAVTPVGHAVHIALGNPTPTLTIAGAPQDGHTVTAVVGSWVTPTVTTTYAWFSCDGISPLCSQADTSTYIAIPGATKSTLLLHAAYGAFVVRATGTKIGYSTSTAESAPLGVDLATQIDLTTVPKIVGTSVTTGTPGLQAHVGAKLTATPATASITGVTHAYTWQTQLCDPATCDPVNGWTDGPTGPTYTPTAADYDPTGMAIRLKDVVSKPGTSDVTAYSTAYTVGLGTIAVTTAPKVIATTPQFSVSAGVYVPAGSTPTYTWSVDGTADATPGTAVRLRDPAEATKAIYVDVTYSAPGYLDKTTRVLAQRGATQNAVTETVNGTHYGRALGLSAPAPFTDAFASGPSPRTLGYQWYSNGVKIKGAIRSTFVPTPAYIGKHISVWVTGTSPYYATGLQKTAAITLASGAFTASIPTISFTGTLQPGVVATAVPDTSTNYGASRITFKYQWQRQIGAGAWVSIPKATLAHYTPTATDANDQLRVIVTASKALFVTKSLVSLPSTIHYSPVLATFTPPVLTGTFQVDGPISLGIGVWNTPSLTYVYKWYRNGVLIPGVTGLAYTPTADSVGDVLTATVTAGRVGWQPVTVSSQVVVVAPADAPVATVAPVVQALASPVGSFTVTPGTWNVDGLTYAFQWYVGGAPASGTLPLGANTSTFTPDGSQTGTVSVVITASRNGYVTTVTDPIIGPVI